MYDLSHKTYQLKAVEKNVHLPKFITMKINRFLIFLVLFLVVSEANSQHVEPADRGYIVEVGDKAPDVTLRMTTGEILKLSDLRDKIVVLQFTASWCSVCRKEMPHLEKEVWQQLKDKDFLLIGVDYDEPLAKVDAFKSR